ncbi:MAG: hypothetical protein UY52_C0011G0079, partial [Parcubacteria group bacterium GW2011_GWC2_49_9]
ISRTSLCALIMVSHIPEFVSQIRIDTVVDLEHGTK